MNAIQRRETAHSLNLLADDLFRNADLVSAESIEYAQKLRVQANLALHYARTLNERHDR